MFKFERNILKSVLNANKQRAVLATAGLALFGGVALGHADAVQAATGTTPAAAPAATVATASVQDAPKARKPKVPSRAALMPHGVPSNQVSFKPDADQKANANRIIKAGQRMNMSPRAQVIAVATALQESHLNNYGHLGNRNDHDSLGLFQQRPSSGWGSPDELTDPDYAARAFYSALKNVDGYKRMPLTDAAQAVQVSAYPDAYAKWEKQAAGLVKQYHATKAHK